jgi:HEAT repeat protein
VTLRAALLGALVLLSALLALCAVGAGVHRLVRTRVAARRERVRREVRPHLLGLLAHDDDDGEAVALPELGRRDGVLATVALEVLPKLRGADRRPLVRLLEREGVVARARRRSRSASAERRAAAAEVLGTVGDGVAWAELTRLLGDRDATVRIVAARALGHLGDAAAVPLLVGRIDPLDGRPVPAGIVAMALHRLGAGAVPGLLDALATPGPVATRRVVAAQLLGQQRATTAVAPLLAVAAAADEPAALRVAAVHAPGRIGAPRAAAVLLPLLTAGAAAVRGAAAEALGELGGTGVVDALRSAAAGPEPGVAHAACAALVAQGPPGATVLRELAVGADPVAAAHAAEQLALAALAAERSGAPAAIPPASTPMPARAPGAPTATAVR